MTAFVDCYNKLHHLNVPLILSPDKKSYIASFLNSSKYYYENLNLQLFNDGLFVLPFPYLCSTTLNSQCAYRFNFNVFGRAQGDSTVRFVRPSVVWLVPILIFSALLSVLSLLLLSKCPIDLLHHCPFPPTRD